jgi:hypothetical protein
VCITSFCTVSERLGFDVFLSCCEKRFGEEEERLAGG